MLGFNEIEQLVKLEITAYEGKEEPLIKACDSIQSPLDNDLGGVLTFMIAEGDYIFKPTENKQTFIVECPYGVDTFYLDQLCELTGRKGKTSLESVYITEVEGKAVKVGYYKGKVTGSLDM